VPLVVLLGVLLSGCADRSSKQAQPARPPGPIEQEAGRNADQAPGNAVTVRVVDEAEFAQALQQYRGKVVLVDIWATWCTSCLELFPHTVELSKRFADRGLVVISLSIDDPENESGVLEKLVSNGAAFDNFISRYGGSTKSLDAFGLEDGVLPIYRLYDRTGSLHKTLRSSQGLIRAEDVDRAVEELLGESQPRPTRSNLP